MTNLTEVKNQMDENLSERISDQTSGQFGISIKYDDEIIYLNQQEFEDIKNISNIENDIMLTQINDNAEYSYTLSMNFDKDINDYTNMIKVLFAMHKYMDAWKYISEKIEKVNYRELSDFRHFRLKRDEYKVFRYLYDNSIIGENDYARLLVLSGKMYDMNFWKLYFKTQLASSACNILKVIKKSFGDVNPMDVGLVEFEGEFKKFFLSVLNDGKLDDYLVNDACVLFKYDDLKYFIENNNFDNTNYALYVMAQYFDEYTTNNEYAEYFNMVLKYSNDISQYYIDNENIFIEAVDSMDKINHENQYNFTKMICSSDIAPRYINTIKNKLRTMPDDSFYDLRDILFRNGPIMQNILSDLCMKNIYKYKLNNLNTSNYIYMPSVRFAGYIVYNTDNGNLMYADKVYNYKEFRKQIRIFDEFKDDPEYRYHEISDTERSYLDACKSESEFREFMFGVCELFDMIDNMYGENIY